MTRFPGQFYTQQECQELEKFAAERGVIIIPEIDMPGHSKAFERALGYSMQTDKGVETLKDIIDEVIRTFPSAPYIHRGADEQIITYPNFLKIMTDKIHSAGKKVIVWNPIHGVKIEAESGFDMTQMWSSGGKKIADIPNIDCRYNYINHFDIFADVVGIYKSNIYYQQYGDREISGAITAIWNDRKLANEQDIICENNFYANALATGERTWKGGGKTYIEQGGTPLYCHTNEYKEFSDWERRFLFHKRHSLKNENIPYVKQCNVHWYITEPFPNEGNTNSVFPPEIEGPQKSYIYKGKEYKIIHATGAGIYLRHTWGEVVPSHFEKPQLESTAYAWTYIYSPITQHVGAQVEFQNYGRSEKDLSPANNKWDRKGSRLWINDQEIIAPIWDNSNKKSMSNEDILLNENFVSRTPVQFTLNKGWNKIFLKLPYTKVEGVRLNKWMFTFVVTDIDGNQEISNILYEPGHGL